MLQENMLACLTEISKFPITQLLIQYINLYIFRYRQHFKLDEAKISNCQPTRPLAYYQFLNPPPPYTVKYFPRYDNPTQIEEYKSIALLTMRTEHFLHRPIFKRPTLIGYLDNNYSYYEHKIASSFQANCLSTVTR